jgi:hypothetical protein
MFEVPKVVGVAQERVTNVVKFAAVAQLLVSEATAEQIVCTWNSYCVFEVNPEMANVFAVAVVEVQVAAPTTR